MDNLVHLTWFGVQYPEALHLVLRYIRTYTLLSENAIRKSKLFILLGPGQFHGSNSRSDLERLELTGSK